MDDQQSAVVQNVRLELEDDSSGAYATGSISFSGTPSGAGSFLIGAVSSDEIFHFDQNSTILSIHEAISNFVNSHPLSANFSATFDASAVYLTSKFQYSGINNLDLQASFITASGLTVNVVAPSGGIDPTPTGYLDISFDGSFSARNIDSSYDSKVIADRSYFVGKMRSEISLPAIDETVIDRDVNGDITQVQILF